MLNGKLNEKRSFLSGDGTKIDKLCYDWFVAARRKGIRHNISFKAISGEEASVYAAFLEKLPFLIKGYSPRETSIMAMRQACILGLYPTKCSH